MFCGGDGGGGVVFVGYLAVGRRVFGGLAILIYRSTASTSITIGVALRDAERIDEIDPGHSTWIPLAFLSTNET